MIAHQLDVPPARIGEPAVFGDKVAMANIQRFAKRQKPDGFQKLNRVFR